MPALWEGGCGSQREAPSPGSCLTPPVPELLSRFSQFAVLAPSR